MQKQSRRTLYAAAALLLAAALSEAKMIIIPIDAVTPTPSTQPAPEPSAEVRAAVAGLSAADFKTREAAQSLIDVVPLDGRAILAALLSTQRDAEVKSRLQRRLDAMDFELAIDPPPITLHLNNANSRELFQAMSDQMNLPLTGYRSSESLTLDLDHRPFTDVYAMLCQKRVGLVSAGAGNLNLPMIQTYQNYKGFTAYFGGLTTTKTVDVLSHVYERTQLTVGVFADPRVQVLHVNGPQILHVVDDAGNVLLDRKYSPPERVAEALETTWQGNCEFSIPEKPGNRIASIKGQASFQVVVASESHTVTDIQKHAGEVFTIGGGRFMVDRFTLDENKAATLSLRLISGDSTPFEFTLSDARDGLFMHRYVVQGTTVKLPFVADVPITMTITQPTKTRTIDVPFELKDVPYPH